MDLTLVEENDARVAQIEANMREAGVPTEEKVQVDYFDFDVTHRVYLPDGVSWVEHRELNEGERSRYLNTTNKDLRLQKVTGDAIVRLAPGDERKALLSAAIVNWNLVRGGKPVKFSTQSLNDFLTKPPPKILDLIEKEVRKCNAWLLAEVSVDDLRKEVDTLNELIAKKLEEEAGKAD